MLGAEVALRVGRCCPSRHRCPGLRGGLSACPCALACACSSGNLRPGLAVDRQEAIVIDVARASDLGGCARLLWSPPEERSAAARAPRPEVFVAARCRRRIAPAGHRAWPLADASARTAPASARGAGCAAAEAAVGACPAWVGPAGSALPVPRSCTASSAPASPCNPATAAAATAAAASAAAVIASCRDAASSASSASTAAKAAAAALEIAELPLQGRQALRVGRGGTAARRNAAPPPIRTLPRPRRAAWHGVAARPPVALRGMVGLEQAGGSAEPKDDSRRGPLAAESAVTRRLTRALRRRVGAEDARRRPAEREAKGWAPPGEAGALVGHHAGDRAGWAPAPEVAARGAAGATDRPRPSHTPAPHAHAATTRARYPANRKTATR